MPMHFPPADGEVRLVTLISGRWPDRARICSHKVLCMKHYHSIRALHILLQILQYHSPTSISQFLSTLKLPCGVFVGSMRAWTLWIDALCNILLSYHDEIPQKPQVPGLYLCFLGVSIYLTQVQGVAKGPSLTFRRSGKPTSRLGICLRRQETYQNRYR
jgi:hypothetical protein